MFMLDRCLMVIEGNDMKIHGMPKIEMDLTIRLTEEEARAIHAMGGYGDDEFVKTFYHGLGTAYMQEHEQGLRSFLRTSHELGNWLNRLNKARQVFEDQR